MAYHPVCLVTESATHYRAVPIHMNAIPSSIRPRSTILARRLRSLKIKAAHANDTMTELRRTSDTTEIIDPESFNEVKYAKSAMHMNSEISGMLHLHVNEVLWCRFGYQSSPHMTAMMIIW